MPWHTAVRIDGFSVTEFANAPSGSKETPGITATTEGGSNMATQVNNECSIYNQEIIAAYGKYLLNFEKLYWYIEGGLLKESNHVFGFKSTVTISTQIRR